MTRPMRCGAVGRAGQIKWRGEYVFVSEAVRGELVGLAEMATGDWRVQFMHVELGRIRNR